MQWRKSEISHLMHIHFFEQLKTNVGSATGAFQFIKEVGYVPFETCQPYMACSSDSTEPFCQHVDTQCTPMNICKTCTRNLSGIGSTCNQVSQFPHARGENLSKRFLFTSINLDCTLTIF